MTERTCNFNVTYSSVKSQTTSVHDNKKIILHTVILPLDGTSCSHYKLYKESAMMVTKKYFPSEVLLLHVSISCVQSSSPGRTSPTHEWELVFTESTEKSENVRAWATPNKAVTVWSQEITGSATSAGTCLLAMGATVPSVVIQVCSFFHVTCIISRLCDKQKMEKHTDF